MFLINGYSFILFFEYIIKKKKNVNNVHGTRTPSLHFKISVV